MNPVTGRINEHGARTVDNISRRHLLRTFLEQIFLGDLPAGILLLIDRKDGADADVDVYIGGAVQWIHHKNIFPRPFRGNDNRLVVLFRGDGAQETGVPQQFGKNLIGVLIQFLDFLTVNIHPAGETENVFPQARVIDFQRDEFGRDQDFHHQAGEFTGGPFGHGLLLPQMLNQGFSFHLIPHWGLLNIIRVWYRLEAGRGDSN